MREIAAMQSMMDRFFEDSLRGFDTTADNTLALDIHESDEAYLLLANLPGVNSDNIEVTLHDGLLHISAEMPKAEVAEDVRVRMEERPYGTYTRSIRLPKAVDNTAVEAAYENGVLALTLPKAEDAQPRQIPIKVNGTLTDGNNS